MIGTGTNAASEMKFIFKFDGIIEVGCGELGREFCARRQNGRVSEVIVGIGLLENNAGRIGGSAECVMRGMGPVGEVQGLCVGMDVLSEIFVGWCRKKFVWEQHGDEPMFLNATKRFFDKQCRNISGLSAFFHFSGNGSLIECM